MYYSIAARDFQGISPWRRNFSAQAAKIFLKKVLTNAKPCGIMSNTLPLKRQEERKQGAHNTLKEQGIKAIKDF